MVHECVNERESHCSHVFSSSRSEACICRELWGCLYVDMSVKTDHGSLRVMNSWWQIYSYGFAMRVGQWVTLWIFVPGLSLLSYSSSLLIIAFLYAFTNFPLSFCWLTCKLHNRANMNTNFCHRIQKSSLLVCECLPFVKACHTLVSVSLSTFHGCQYLDNMWILKCTFTLF